MASAYVFPMAGEWGLDGALAAGLPPLAQLAEGQPDTVIRGFLRAWDPVKQKLIWEVETSGQWVGSDFAFWNGGGVMSTASDLVFQGRGSGFLHVYDARTGKELHRIETGSSIMAAPMTYTVDGVQFVAVAAGLGGGGGQAHPAGSAAYRYGNEGRILAFRLGGGAVPLRPEVAAGANEFVRPPIGNDAQEPQIAAGQALYMKNCAKCHSTLDGRGSGIPDLRRMDAATHDDFIAIVLEGTRASKGMGSFASLLSEADAEAVHAYLIDLAWKAYEKQEQDRPRPHEPTGN